MTHYDHNMMHCAQDQCSKKDQCYRYWLGQEIKKVCGWLEEHKEHSFIRCEDPCLSGYLTDEFIEYFKKYMGK